MSQGGNGRACDSRASLPRESVLPRLVSCLRGFLDEQPCRRLLIVVKCAEVGGGGCLDDLQELLQEKECPNCVLDRGLDARIGCDESPPR